MKISCTQENLNHGLFIVSHVASKSSNLPILNNILFQVKDKAIKLSATNLEIGVSCVIRGKMEEEGDFTVGARLLADYVSLLPKDKVDLEAPNVPNGEDQILKVSCRNYHTSIKGQPASDFPLIPSLERAEPYRIPYQEFRQAIAQVIFAVASGETRPEINGVLFNFSNNTLVLAATDSYRLAEKKLQLAGQGQLPSRKVIVPTKTLQELSRILGGVKDPASISDVEHIDVYVAEGQILFVLDNIELISRLVEAQYPDYEQIIPQEVKTKAVVDTAELIKATKSNSLFARSGIYDVNLELSDNEVSVSSANSQLGESKSKLDATIDGAPNRVVVNYRYLLDGLQNMGTEQVEIRVVDGNFPCVIRPVDKSQSYLYIIMPIKQ